MAKKLTKAKPDLMKLKVTTAQAANLLDVSVEWIRRLAQRGHIKKLGKDEYRLVDVLKGYAASLEDDGRLTRQSTSATRVFTARAEELENQNAKELEEVTPAEDVILFHQEMQAIIEKELSDAPDGIDDPKARAACAKQIEHALAEYRKSIAEASATLAAGKGLPLSELE